MDKRAIITGASSGIGYAISEAALNQGYLVTGQGRDFSKVSRRPTTTVVLDLADTRAVKEYCQSVRKDSAPLDLLVLNAGYGQFGSLEQFSSDQIESMIAVNVTANLLILAAVMPKMKAQKTGDVVLIGSESALVGAKQGSVYCAGKFALRGIAQSLQAECAGTGVRVILVNPGPVRSNFFNNLNFEPEHGNEHAMAPQDVAQCVFDTLALPRTVIVEEVNLQTSKRVFVKKQPTN